MTPPWATCADCSADLYPRLARRSERGWVCAERERCERREDIRYMAATGESATGAAYRLGIGLDAFGRFCRRHGLREELRQMLARDRAEAA